MWAGFFHISFSNLTETKSKHSRSFAQKRLKGLCPQTHTAGAIGTIGMWTTTGYIDKIKLLLLGSLCRSSPLYLHKQPFLKRLFSYLTQGCPVALGYVPDIINILKTYNLYSYLDHYLKNCTFPSKSIWRKNVVDTLNNHEITKWKEEFER